MESSLSNTNVNMSFRKIAVLTAVIVLLGLIPVITIVIIEQIIKKRDGCQ